jgi:DNA-binding winged helix-turn-helix (wHTH) protein
VIEHKPFVFSFGNVEVREREFCIVKSGEVVPVEPKAFRVLIFLLRNPHRLITKDELLDAVWNDVAVSENSLTRSIALLRRLLGDDTREPRYIATVPTVGYRFLCDVEAAEDGFRGVDAPDLRHRDNGDGFESLRKTHGVQGGSQNPQNRTAVVDEVKERVERPSNEGRRQPRRPLLPGLIATALVILGTVFLVYRAVANRGTSAYGSTHECGRCIIAYARRTAYQSSRHLWASCILPEWRGDRVYLGWRKSVQGRSLCSANRRRKAVAAYPYPKRIRLL